MSIAVLFIIVKRNRNTLSKNRGLIEKSVVRHEIECYLAVKNDVHMTVCPNVFKVAFKTRNS